MVVLPLLPFCFEVFERIGVWFEICLAIDVESSSWRRLFKVILNCARPTPRKKPAPKKPNCVLRTSRRNLICFWRITNWWKTLSKSVLNRNSWNKRWRSRARATKINFSAWMKSNFTWFYTGRETLMLGLSYLNKVHLKHPFSSIFEDDC